ncbi:sulfatase [Candidatus Neomarinimicrobiota bacterium]
MSKFNQSKSDWSRKDFLKILGIGTMGCAMPVSLFPNVVIKRNRKPNVLFVAVDDLRPQLGCYGHEQMISPNIDQFATTGTVFGRTYCQVPVCGASRASLLTGLRPTRTRFVNFETVADSDAPDAANLPRYLNQQGYSTISLGKVFHHQTDGQESWSEPPWRPSGDWTGRGYLSDLGRSITRKAEGGRGPAFESPNVPDNTYPDGVLTDKALSELRRLKALDHPFFLAVGYLKPHLPFNAPARFWNMYQREHIDLADNPFRPQGAPDAALHNWGELRNYHGIPEKGPLPDDLALTLIHGYYACVSYTDFQIGLLLAELDKLGLRENTVVVLWGDHGWNLGEHGLWCKHCNFETSLHSPLIVSAPGHNGGKKTEALTEFVDIYPSIVEQCGLSLPDHLHGQSFAPLMDAPAMDWKNAVFSRYRDGDSVKTDRYRYTEWSRENGEVYARMLYDHFVDPAENKNISELTSNKGIVHSLQELLHDV